MNEFSVKKYQIRCPKCKHEFVWDMTPLDVEIERVRKRQAELMRIVAEMKAHNDPIRLGYSVEYKEKKARLSECIERVTELKTIRKNNTIITDDIFNREFKDLVREVYGDETYFSLLQKVKERLKPESVERMMQGK